MASSPAAPAFSLPALPYLRLSVELRALAAAVLPPYKGSLLRGGFGHALRASVCSMGPAQPCETCTLRRVCVYPRLFESFVEGEVPPFLGGIDTAPRPYVFEPGDERREVAAGGRLGFDLVLFGQAVELAPYAELAVERMAAAGLGARRHRFALDTVRRAAGVVGEAAAGEAAARGGNAPGSGPAGGAAGATGAGPGAGPSRLRLHLLTPLRLKVSGRLVDERAAGRLRFRDLAFGMLRRVLELACFHLPGAVIDWEIRPLLAAASEVRIAAAELAFHDWERWSNRQQRKMGMGGVVGTIDLEGDLAPFLPLLRAIEVTHFGKGTTFGLGQVALGDKWRSETGGARRQVALEGAVPC